MGSSGEDAPNGYEALVNSASMRLIDAAVTRVAPTDVTVLISGESGVGKELVARTLHHRSRRHDGPFVKVNCAALPFTLLESELFGYERGAFTGADHPKRGKFEQAHRGTIFLDEISEMPLSVQAKLLQVLQDHEFSRLGSEHDIRVDVRVIAATNRDLARYVVEGGFPGGRLPSAERGAPSSSAPAGAPGGDRDPCPALPDPVPSTAWRRTVAGFSGNARTAAALPLAWQRP
jgi:transcriptional regulator with GAF, ATPase, and Fis domain